VGRPADLQRLETARPEQVGECPGELRSQDAAPVGGGEEWRATSTDDLAPSSDQRRLAANLDALRVLRRLDESGAAATPDEQATLARWSAWGSLPKVFDENDPAFAPARAELRSLLDETEWAAAARTTLNAHYTDFDVAAAMWEAAVDLGFAGGKLLEAGVGSGTFLATVPAGVPVEAVGVEVDPVTARIAKALHPAATIRAESFAATRYPDAWFDLAIGNVPFGDYKLFDPVHNQSRVSIHNFFIYKALRLTRPGGHVVALTSRFTLDATSHTARAEIAEVGDLLGAVRLPEGAMRKVAGTDVAMDLLVFRRRSRGSPPTGEAFIDTVPFLDGGETPVPVNELFVRHPEWVLGSMKLRRGQYGHDDLAVRPLDAPLAPRLRSALAGIVKQARSASSNQTSAAPPDPIGAAPAGDHCAEVVLDAVRGPHHVERSLLRRAGGGYAVIKQGVTVAHQPPASQAAELGELIDLRDAYFALIDAQGAVGSDTDWQQAQARLRELYDRYATTYGPVNRYRQVPTGRRDADGQPVTSRRFPPMGGFNRDPGLAVVRSLEIFDDDTATATKAAIFEARTLKPRFPRIGADSPEDALALCLDECGHVDIDTIARLLGCNPEEARTGLGTLVYDNPEGGPPLTAAAYLSGDVRARLAAARTAASSGEVRWDANVAALEAVQPRDLEPSEIDARLGAPWIPPADVIAFCAEVLEAEVAVEYAAATGEWVLAMRVGTSNTLALTSEWGTGRVNAVRLVEANANQRLATVTDETPDGQRLTNLAETLAAREKQEALNQRFGEWVWENPERADRLAGEYNRRFNSIVLPAYDGSHLSLPGLAANFRPHAHQRDAVWRILSEPTVLLAHGVGAGKTATMVIAGREMKRLGMVNKPAYVVPNHMLEQFSREYLQLYPQAKVLVAGRDDISPAQRKEFVARCAGEDWDAVIVTHASFERIPVSSETEQAFLDSRVAELRASIAASQTTGTGLTVKQLEKTVARVEERHKALISDRRRDSGGVNFEATGIDYICLDEAQAHKNLAITSRIPGVRCEGSKRAEDLVMKLDWLRQTHGHRVATFATATPIANSVAEMYVMQRYLQPDTLAAAGVEHFDGWAANFGRTVTALELAPDSSSYRMTTRFARFANVPDLLRMFRTVADVRTGEELHLTVPELAGGRAETVVVPASDGLKEYVAELADRAEAIRNKAVSPEQDNMLKVSGDGRKAALDLRMVERAPDPTGGKLAAAATVIAEIYQHSRDRAYMGDDRARSGRRGSLQLVFCDLGTPNPDRPWCVYDQLRAELTQRGVPQNAIRYMHQARNDMEKARLFSAARAGNIAVLIGSTEKMGVGTNVQARAVALHHIDCPWRPADLEQREGRILRQGNQNAEVRIIRYVTEGSFDVFSWQTVERKAAFINQVMHGHITERSIDDIGDQALSYAEVKALATGNPLIMEKAGVEAELTRLERLHAAYRNDQSNLARRIKASEREAAEQQALAAAYRAAAERAIDTSGDRFTMVIGAQKYTKRTEAAPALVNHLVESARRAAERDSSIQIGELAGFPVVARVTRDMGEQSINLSLEGVPRSVPAVNLTEVSTGPPLGLLTRLENLADDLESRAASAEQRSIQAREDSAKAAARMGHRFEHAGRIETLRARLVEINTELAPPPEPAPEPVTQPAPPPAVDERAAASSRIAARRRRWAATFGATGLADAGPALGPDLSI
jgi:N12 class adenine-specific DNA methylase